MKIKSVCEQTGLTDKAVRYYIQNGLVFPIYKENYTGRKNYNFSNDDVERLKKISIMRKYDFSINSIKNIIDDEGCIKNILNMHISEMKSKTDNDIKMINELIETSINNPQTLNELCSGLNNSNYIVKSVPKLDNEALYKRLYNSLKKEVKILSIFLVLLIIISIMSFGAYFIKSWTKVDVVSDIEQYQSILGTSGEYKSNYIGVNNIFPNEIPLSADIEKFCYIYYDTFDANYLGYLVYTCSDEDYKIEYNRLKSLNKTKNYKVYGATGFNYELCAVMSDEYNGIIYALTDSEENRFIYVDLEFTDYYTDIDYEMIVNKDHLPIGFNAKKNNETRSLFEKEFLND
jgi:DNA-binding transcriptional MerR regulator